MSTRTAAMAQVHAAALSEAARSSWLSARSLRKLNPAQRAEHFERLCDLQWRAQVVYGLERSVRLSDTDL